MWEELLKVNPKKVILFVLLPFFLLLGLYIYKSSGETLVWSLIIAFVFIWSIGLGIALILFFLSGLIELFVAISDSLRKSIIWILRRLQ